jgi:hypothetical protein
LWTNSRDNSCQGQDFSFPHNVQTSSEATQLPIHWVSGVKSPRVKKQRHEADHSPLSRAEVKNSGAIPPLLHYVFMAECFKNMDNFTLSWYLHEGTGENHKKSQCSGQDSNWALHKYKSETLPLRPTTSAHLTTLPVMSNTKQ